MKEIILLKLGEIVLKGLKNQLITQIYVKK